MRLLIDAGNTRIKWAVTAGDDWLRSGAVPTAAAAGLPQQLGDLRNVREIWVSNVAGEAVAAQLHALKQVAPLRFIAACATQCGVRNGYEDPASLGSDRWAALIAAWKLLGRACLVVNSGTAITVDALSAQGEFMGGLILPGIDLMQRSLNEATAQLRPEPGSYAAFPRNTADALYSGALQAACGAIERQHGLLGAPDAPLVLGGGAADILHERLTLPRRLVDNLVLQGLWSIAQETST